MNEQDLLQKYKAATDFLIKANKESHKYVPYLEEQLLLASKMKLKPDRFIKIVFNGTFWEEVK